MKYDSKKIHKLLKTSLTVSILCIIVGFVLWYMFIPQQDFNLQTEEMLRQAQREFAINYPLGRFLLYLGFTGLGVTTIGFMWRKSKE